jgi:predicted nucleic acid-binding protein
MAADRYLVDSNILIRWSQPGDPGFPIADNSLFEIERLKADLCYTSQNLGEFWNALTRPANRNGYGQSIGEANRCALAIEARLRLLPDTVAVHQEWRKLLVDYGVSGVQVHDARLVAAMHIHDVKHILTFNTRDFARFTDIEAIHPADFKH